MFIEQSEFKGNPMLVIKNDENDRFPFSFGLSKAKKILGAIDEIKAFVEKNDKKPEEQQ
jgi:CO dehydrogenase nickel-insertion accessory protein CooC1